MEIIVHRGTHQIGGCVTEIKSEKGTRIAIDIGENLPSMTKKENIELDVAGLTNREEKPFDAVIVTHYHGDHIGLYNKVLPEIPIYMGEVSKEIYKIVQESLEYANLITEEEFERIKKFKTYKIPNKIKIGDILITPIEVDHSAFNAHMLKIECDGKILLHTGDFRLHGQRGNSVIPALEKYVGKVDCLICEGTTLSRKKEPTLTEFQLQGKAEKIFKDNKYNFVYCSCTNIDRLAAVKDASKKANRIFVCDVVQAKILNYIDSIARSDYYKFKGKYKEFSYNLIDEMKLKGFVMPIRNNNFSRKMLKIFSKNKFIYSNWEGYLESELDEYKTLKELVPKDCIFLHTSGHADIGAIKKVCETVNPEIIIPVHSEAPEVFYNMRIKK